MTDWKPGTVAVATVAGDEGVRVSRYDGGWARLDDVDRCYNDVHPGPGRALVTGVRPLVVLDLSWAESVPVLVAQLRGGGYNPIADQIEAQAKPPRIPEPGLWGVVSTEDAEGLTTYRWRSHGGWHGEDGSIHEWSALIDPTLIREGVES